jgi:hypothetical protein
MGDVTGPPGLREDEDPVGKHAGVRRADRLDPRRRQFKWQRRRLDDQIVVPQCVPLLEFHARGVYAQRADE